MSETNRASEIPRGVGGGEREREIEREQYRKIKCDIERESEKTAFHRMVHTVYACVCVEVRASAYVRVNVCLCAYLEIHRWYTRYMCACA